jgi:hypothetical protein
MIMDSVAGDEPELRNFSFAPGSVVMLPAGLAEKWLATGLAIEVHADTALHDPTQQGKRRYF